MVINVGLTKKSSVYISPDRESAYAVLENDIHPDDLRAVHAVLAEYDFELMDPEECPGEPVGEGRTRHWAARRPARGPYLYWAIVDGEWVALSDFATARAS